MAIIHLLLTWVAAALVGLLVLRLWDGRANRKEWASAAVLPGPDVIWEGVDAYTARVTVSHEGLSQAVDVTVDARGRPLAVSFMRWSNANPDRMYRFQPFGGYLSDFREVQGFRLPFRVEAGNMFGTAECFAFYRAAVTAVRFPGEWQRWPSYP